MSNGRALRLLSLSRGYPGLKVAAGSTAQGQVGIGNHIRRSMARKNQRSEWNFAASARGEWRWRVKHPDGTEVCSLRRFTVLQDCIADARRHGYVGYKPKFERRKSD